MVEESDRIWLNIDLHQKSLADHCVRITRLEQTHYDSGKSKERMVTIILGIVVVVQLIILITDKLTSV